MLEPVAPTFHGVRRMTLNFSTGAAEVEMDDGTVITEPLAAAAPPGLRRSSYNCTKGVLSLDLVNIGAIEVEIGYPGSDRQRLAGRPVVYLDQNQWIALAQSETSSHRLRERERAPAARLVELARAGAIVLPLSAAHYTETARTGGVQRQNSAHTMLTLSRGWSLRHPMAIRVSELLVMFGNVGIRTRAIPIPPPVITLDPSEFWSPSHDLASSRVAMDGVPTGYVDLHQRLVTISSHVHVLTEDVAERFGREQADAWADSHQGLLGHMGGNPHATRYKRGLTRAKFVTDMGDILAIAARDAGLTPEELSAWLNFQQEDAPSEASLRAMPYLGRVREVTHSRLANRDERWEANDLTDLHFLSAAAGYSDVIIGERKHIEYVKRAARKVTSGAALARSLQSGLPLIEALVEKERAVGSQRC